MESKALLSRYWFLEDGGETGKLTRNFDWNTTSIGSPDSWPGPLRTSVDVLLHSKFPMLLWWGEELVQFYNDAFIPNFGAKSRHPHAIGSTAQETWPEIWEFIKPLIDKVRNEGESVLVENQPLRILRNGILEDSYFTFSYSPVRNEYGMVEGVMVVCREVADYVQSLKRLRESEAMLQQTASRLQLALEAGQMGSYDMNIATGYIDCSSQCKRNFGLPLHTKFYFEQLLEMIFAEDRPAMQRSVESSIRTGSIYDAQYRIKLHDDSMRWIHARGMATYDEKRNPVRLVGITQDITSQKNFSDELKRQVKLRTDELAEVNTELNLANKSLLHSNEELSQYAFIASHDLQEPLRKILVYANQLMTKSELPDHQRNWATKIQSASERMNRLIADLLLHARLTDLDQKFSEVDLAEIVAGVLSDFEITIREKKAVIEVAALPVINAVSLQMNQLFANLLSNALKFTVAGRAPVSRIKVEELGREQYSSFDFAFDEYAKYILITFSDNGVGFENEYAGQIFDVFRRLHKEDNYSGSGIGLAICKRIVNNHQGFIDVKSVVGEGTEFSIVLPKGA